MYEYPWDPASDPQKFHINDKSGHQINCEDGKLTEECYKTRWTPPEPEDVVVPIQDNTRQDSHRIVPKGEGTGTADTVLPPDEPGETPPPLAPPGKLPPTRRNSGTAPRPAGGTGEIPSSQADSEGVERERGESEFQQPVGKPETITGTPPEPRKGVPPEGRSNAGPHARPNTG